MKKLLGLTLCIAAMASFAACGGSSDSSTASISSIDQLPKATDPVTAAASAMVVGKTASATPRYAIKDLATAIFSSSDETKGNSRSACELSNVMRNAFTAGATSDKILCYIGQTFAANTDGSFDLYDGAWHVLRLAAADPAETAPGHVKMRIVKSGTSIQSFEMFSCTEKGGTQNEYLMSEINGSEYSMTGISYHDEAGSSGRNKVTVTGTLNSSGKFTQKTYHVWNKNLNQGIYQNWGEAILEQLSNSFEVTGYQKGNFGEFSYGNMMFANGLLQNPATDMRDTAFGIGAIEANIEGFQVVPSDAWDNDLRSIATTDASVASYVEALANNYYPGEAGAPTDGSVPTVVTTYDAFDVSFSGDQIYDCNDEEYANTITVPADLDAGACAPYTLDYTYIECQNLINN